MKKRMIFPQNDVFPQNDEDTIDSVFHWRRKYNEAVDKWIRLDSTLTKVIRESDEKDKQIAFLKDSHDAIRELAYNTGVQEEREACAKLCLETEPYYGVTFARAIRARGEA